MLFFVKNLCDVPVLLPSAALRSAVTVTAPVVAVSGVKSIKVPSVVVKLVTPEFVAGTLVQAVPS